MQKQFTAQDLTNFVSKITQAKTLDEIYEIGRELVGYEGNGYKKAVISVYKTRKKEIIQEMTQENTIFSNLYFLIKMAEGEVLKQVGKLLYNLKQVLPKSEISYLFDIYETKKEKAEKEETIDVEEIV